jgi:hypothetical protein
MRHQQFGMSFHDAERCDHICVPHREHPTDPLRIAACRELDDDLASAFRHVDMRRPVLSRRQQNPDSEPRMAQHDGH